MGLGKNIGILGCSSRMKHVLRFLFDINPNHKILAVHDIKEEAMKDYVAFFGSEIETCLSSRDLVSNPKIDWIFVGSTNNLHAKYIVEAMKNGKNVFSEKPLAISVSECEQILDVFREKNPLFFISYPLRFSPHYKKIKEIINQGHIGKVISLEFNEILIFRHGAFIMSDWRRFKELSGGHLLEKCCHDIDLINWILGSKPCKIASFGGLNLFKPENSYILDQIEGQGEEVLGSYKKWKSNPFTSNKDIVDNQVLIIEYENGVKATFHTNCNSGLPERRMYICGSEGTLRADLLTGKIELNKIGPDKIPDLIRDDENKGGHGGGDLILVNRLNSLMLGENHDEDYLLDSIKSVITCLAADESMEKGEVVILGNLWKKLKI